MVGIGMSLPFGPSPLKGGYGTLKMDHANMTLGMNGMLEGFSNSSLGKILSSAMGQMTNMVGGNFGLGGKSGVGGLLGGLKTTMGNLMPGADQLLTKFETVAMPAVITKSLADAVVKTDDPQAKQRQQQKLRAIAPPGMGGPGGMSGPSGDA